MLRMKSTESQLHDVPRFALFNGQILLHIESVGPGFSRAAAT